MGKTHKRNSYDYDDSDAYQTKKQRKRDLNRRKEKRMKNAIRSKNLDLNIFEDDDYADV